MKCGAIGCERWRNGVFKAARPFVQILTSICLPFDLFLVLIVTVDVKCRDVTVTGPMGTLNRSFKHMSLDMEKNADNTEIKVDIWFGNREAIAAIRTVCSHVENMITGVTKGFKYIMRFCYAHFPINVSCVDSDKNKKVVEIRNFLGEKQVRRIELLEGVNYTKNADIKDQIEITGIDITKVSLSCARISQSTNVRKKDIRKFLDGIYVSEKTNEVVSNEK